MVILGTEAHATADSIEPWAFRRLLLISAYRRETHRQNTWYRWNKNCHCDQDYLLVSCLSGKSTCAVVHTPSCVLVVSCILKCKKITMTVLLDRFDVFYWQWIPVLWRVLELLWVLCSGGRGVGCLSGHITGQNGFLSGRPGMTALHCWLLFPPGG